MKHFTLALFTTFIALSCSSVHADDDITPGNPTPRQAALNAKNSTVKTQSPDVLKEKKVLAEVEEGQLRKVKATEKKFGKESPQAKIARDEASKVIHKEREKESGIIKKNRPKSPQQ